MKYCAVIVLMLAGSASGQLQSFEASFEGQVNGDTISGSGGGEIDIDQMGRSNASILFSDLPAGFNPLSASLISNLCANAFRADGGSENLWDLGNGNYSVERTFQWIGLPQSLVTVNSTVTNDGSLVNSDSVISGTYDGPTDIIGIDSYSVTWLPSSAPGEFFEAGTVVLNRASGDTLIMQFASIFSGFSSGLSQPQTGIGVFNTTFDGSTLSLEWDGEFDVVPAPATAALLAMGGLTMTRRRR